jgi:hypothetical protein
MLVMCRLSSVKQEENDRQSDQADKPVITQLTQKAGHIFNNSSQEWNLGLAAEKDFHRNPEGDQQQEYLSDFADPSFCFFKKSHL